MKEIALYVDINDREHIKKLLKVNEYSERCHASDQNYFSIKLSSTWHYVFSNYLEEKGGKKKNEETKRKRRVKHIMQELINKISYLLSTSDATSFPF